MTYIIGEPCIDIMDKSCIDVCPVDCIHIGERMLVIDVEECIDCGACEPECPVEAIFPEDALPDKWNAFVEINYAFPKGMTAVDELTETYAVANDVADSFPDVPILGFANHTDTAGLRRAHAAGFDRVVVKSALFERPHEVIDALLASVE